MLLVVLFVVVVVLCALIPHVVGFISVVAVVAVDTKIVDAARTPPRFSFSTPSAQKFKTVFFVL